NGTITSVDPNGDFTYVPDPGFVGVDIITYELCDGCGNCYTETITITVLPAPVANFSVANSGLTANFTDLSTGNPTSWMWDFGDGNSSTSQNPSHTYTNAGSYTVCLTVTNNCGSDTLCEDILLEPCLPPVAVDDFGVICKDATNHLIVDVLANDNFTAPATIPTVYIPTYGVVTFGANHGELQYLPDFGYVGPDTIEYVIQDACGTDTAFFVIEVIDSPSAAFSGSASGTTITFSDLSTGNPSSWTWDFGDGGSSTLQNPVHTYASPGTYTVCLTVGNMCGQDTHCVDYTIMGCSPVDPVNDQLDICGANGGGLDILTNDFIASPVTYTIITGPSNGTITSDDGNGNIYYVPNPGFIGTDMFTYQLCNLCGMCGTAQVTINVSGPPGAEIANANVSGMTVSLSAVPVPSGVYQWQMGNGVVLNGLNVMYTYPQGGDFTVCLTVTNPCGTDITCIVVTVGDPCDQPVAVEDHEQVCPDQSVSFNVLINDSFTPPPTVHVVVPPSHGSLVFLDPATGDMTYQASVSFPGTDSLMYLLVDQCGSDTAWVHLVCEGGILVDPQVILEGFYDEQLDMMSEGLYDNQLLPLDQPFGGAPWNYTGLEFVNSYADFSGLDGNVSDWIMVYLLDPLDPSEIIDQKACLLWSNGRVTGVDGGPVEFDQPEGQYHLALIPHNHLGIVTGIVHDLDASTPKLIDFTSAAEPTYGGGSDRKAIGGIMALYSGDANSDGAINAVDKNAYWTPQNGTAPSYLNTADFNGDGAVNAVDKNTYWNPNNGSQGQYPFLWPQ
ncbi:MAG: PKD domain-containing protein, partial [Bacteroidota bacterium]